MNIYKTNDVPKNDPRFQVTGAQQMLSACSGGIITSVLMTPLDVVKIRLQIQQKTTIDKFLCCTSLMDRYCNCHPYTFKNMYWYPNKHNLDGTLDAIVKIIRHEGITSLWSGLSPTLLLALPTTVVYFMTYDKLKQTFRSPECQDDGKQSSSSQPIWIPLLAGCTARVWAATCVSPLELIRTKMQSQKLSYLEIRSGLLNLVEQHGLLGLWKGLAPTLMRDVPFSGMYWVTYEAVKSRTPKNGNPFLYSFISGCVGGTVAATLTTPFDVVKTVYQVGVMAKEPVQGYRMSMWKTLIKIYADNGVAGLFCGLTPRLVKVVPACAIMIGSFEYGKSYFYNKNVIEYFRDETAAA